MDHPRLAQPVEAFGSILELCSILQCQAREACEGWEGTQKGHFPRATVSQAGAEVGARLFLIFGTSEQEAPVTGALFTEHL